MYTAMLRQKGNFVGNADSYPDTSSSSILFGSKKR